MQTEPPKLILEEPGKKSGTGKNSFQKIVFYQLLKWKLLYALALAIFEMGKKHFFELAI